MKKLDIFKNIAELAVSIGVGAVVGNAVKATTPEDLRVYSRFAVKLGGVIVSGIAVKQAQRYVRSEIDDIFKKVDPPIVEKPSKTNKSLKGVSDEA